MCAALFGRGNKARLNLDSIEFDARGFELRGEPRPGQVRAWSTPDADGLGVYYFAQTPDLPQTSESRDFVEVYRSRLKESGGRLVEMSFLRVGGRRAVRVIMKTEPGPAGVLYVGSITIPFLDTSFVLKVQCEERGVSGVREAVLLERRLAAREDSNSGESDAERRRWNPDRAEFDREFPDHPVSRVRRVLRHLAKSVTFTADVAKLPEFPLPESSD